MVFGQIVIGPPGSGKTTYCEGMRQYLQALGRKVAVINLDPVAEPLLSVAGGRTWCSLTATAARARPNARSFTASIPGS